MSLTGPVVQLADLCRPLDRDPRRLPRNDSTRPTGKSSGSVTGAPLLTRRGGR